MSPPCASAPKRSQHEVYILPLTDDGAPDVAHGYVSLPHPTDPPYILRFVIEGSSAVCRQGRLWVNIPHLGARFEREFFREYLLTPSFTHAIQIDIPITTPGAFAFYITYSPPPELPVATFPSPRQIQAQDPAQVQLRSPTHYINVAPTISLNNQTLPLASVSVISLLSKFVGPNPSDWNKHLLSIARRGYNMVHFTPIMARGESNSPYSIADHLAFDRCCFPSGESDVANMVSRMESQYGLLPLTDVVWNHTANNTEWLQEHPEAGYNVETAPWLQAAVELDDTLLRYSEQLGQLGLPTQFDNVNDLLSVMNQMRANVIDKIRLWEFYAVDVQRDVEATIRAYQSGDVRIPEGGFGDHTIGGLGEIKGWSLKEKAGFLRDRGLLNKDRLLGRYGRVVEPAVAAALLTALYGRYDAESSDIPHIRSDLSKIFDEVNLPLFLEFDKDVLEIFDQLFNRIKYLRLDENGPKLGPVTKENPLIETYFTRLPLNEKTAKHNRNTLALVNNGWVWNADAMRDNAGPHSRAYLLRQVIIWGDCVKLRYGSCRGDNPFLWDYMASYTKLMAKYFSAFRIDNCHSTPLAVAEYLLDEARRVRPNLAVFAELFTGSEEMDYLFTKRLGLNALIREAMQSWSTAELSRLVHRHGGRPIGSFDIDLPTDDFPRENGINGGNNGNGKNCGARCETIKHVREIPVQALFMDCTHDNEMPAQKREARDTLPNAALVAMCASASGSVMGYDEIYPAHLDLVQETRRYSSVEPSEGRSADPSDKLSIVGEGGIGGAKRLLNDLHTKMAVDGYDETHIHHDGEYITVHRVQPDTRRGVFLIAHTAFPGANGGALDPVCLTGTKAKLIGAWRLEVDDSDKAKEAVLGDKEYLRGLPSQVISLDGVLISDKEDCTVISMPQSFPSGSIVLLETWIPRAGLSQELSTFITTGAVEAFQKLDLIDLNFVLYRCNAEERDSSDGKDGVYNVPNFRPLSSSRSTTFLHRLGPLLGRDVFISLRGLLLCTGRFDVAKDHIISFASVIKHGMIPNLLGSGKLPRYNSRDSVWFFLQAIQNYVTMVPDGIQLLEEKVPRRFLPYDDTWFPFDDERAYSRSSTIEEIIQEVLQRHASGLSFREYNAGPQLDMQMKPEGFQVDIHVDWETGFMFGGNMWNCGTWMDKMGESEKAANKGYPGTPRDGAAIEITGLLYSALRWVSKLHEEGRYMYAGVTTNSNETIKFSEWAQRIQSNFDRAYYIPVLSSHDAQHDIDPTIVHRRGIYKDLYKSSSPYKDYQLRPNFAIAMTVAPDLFKLENAIHALVVADRVLRGPVGMATLDPGDLNYRPYYNNAEDSEDFATSKGRNYHQGPEWVWPLGFFLRALLRFEIIRRRSLGKENKHEGAERDVNGREEAFQLVASRLEGCKKMIAEGPWKGLTELTNKSGEFCADSAPTQAWSAACLLEVYYDAAQHQKEDRPGDEG
ncbi:glycogen debranching enzyme [Paracoccidioides lutzii Pb01]|uniref:Glycogen debranching enzyme n=1 Tax=Paracoccidioides lutzii (strain ATCC MYA-826 / Pb01) TaxID=502779 RepID=A0A0A2UZZ1_PARBA|nr:glycogen debranching enzyme [Paracoccidioides lutzii Pb01]KGQ01116.1 glycogen debranching enzyme [Paracoccidioides lutzii Pb01]